MLILHCYLFLFYLIIILWSRVKIQKLNDPSFFVYRFLFCWNLFDFSLIPSLVGRKVFYSFFKSCIPHSAKEHIECVINGNFWNFRLWGTIFPLPQKENALKRSLHKHNTYSLPNYHSFCSPLIIFLLFPKTIPRKFFLNFLFLST